MDDIFYIGIDLGGTLIKIGVIENGKVTSLEYLNAESMNGLKAKLPLLKSKIEEIQLAKEHKILEGIGFSFPGIVDPFKKVVLSTNKKYDDACEINLGEWVKKEWNVKFVIDNDARYAVEGEWQYGSGKDSNNVVMMTIGTGIGTGVIINGNLLVGAHFRAPLGGHLTIKYDGRICTCGNRGCIEAYSSSFFLSEIISELPVSNDFKKESSKIDFKEIFELANKGNEDAKIVRDYCIQIWSVGIVNYIHAFDPEVVIIGGGIMKSKEIILPKIKKYVNTYAWMGNDKIKIVASELEDKASILGIYYRLLNEKD